MTRGHLYENDSDVNLTGFESVSKYAMDAVHIAVIRKSIEQRHKVALTL